MLMPEDSGSRLKRCVNCTKERPVSEFNKDASRKDGRQVYCKVCRKKIDRRYYVANKDKVAAKNNRWVAKNKDKVAENNRRYYEKNKDKVAEKKRQWRKDNPKRYAYTNQKNNAERLGIDFLLTFEEWCDWWGDDFCDRGKNKGKLVMARYGGKGPYALGNIKKA